MTAVSRRVRRDKGVGERVQSVTVVDDRRCVVVWRLSCAFHAVWKLGDVTMDAPARGCPRRW